MYKFMKAIEFATILTILAGCTNGQKNQPRVVNSQPPIADLRLIRIEEPQDGAIFPLGDNIHISIKQTGNVAPDSVVLSVNGARVERLGGLTYELSTGGLKMGTQSISLAAWKSGSRQIAGVSVKLKSNFKPEKLTYRVVRSYPHDGRAYTQGLFYHDGYLYEGTGQEGESSLRKVELETGKVLRSINLGREYFGEGIALLKDMIYQLTWTSGIGFIYDFNTFNNLGSFTYATQGWGLTTNGKELIMSNGSNIISFMEPSGFSEVSRIEVFDDVGPVKMLNELEYINGKIYANVYLTDRIVIINAETGAVTADVDLKGILSPSDKTGSEDVLNGIAYDFQGNRLFVTGKYWPKLFEVKLVPVGKR